MPRPSLKEKRSAEILDAFVTCIARHGLEGATQERIADVAGVKRTLLRHYLGNRDDMILAATHHVVETFDTLTDQLGQALQCSDERVNDLIELLFSKANQTDPRLVLAYQALIASAPSYPKIRKPLIDCLTRFVTLIEKTIDGHARKAPAATRMAVAHGIIGLYINLDAFSPLKPPQGWRTATKDAAIMLIQSLEK